MHLPFLRELLYYIKNTQFLSICKFNNIFVLDLTFFIKSSFVYDFQQNLHKIETLAHTKKNP